MWFFARVLSLSLALLFFFSSRQSPVARGEDWFQFRGPDGQGHSSAVGLPTRWSATKNVRWKTAIPGKGWSSPVTFGNRIFLTAAIPTADRQSHSLNALCLEASNGNILWNVTVFDRLVPRSAKQIHSKNSHASPTPVTDGKHIWVHFGAHGTACLTTDGGIVWKTRELEYLPQHGSGGSPVLVDGIVAVSCDGADTQFVVGLDAATGKIRWKKDRPHSDEFKRFAFATPLVIEQNGQKQIVSPGAHGVVAYEPQTGNEIWNVRYTGYSVVPRPVFGKGLLFLSTSYDSSVALAIRPDGHGDVTDSHVGWQQSRSIPYTPSFLLIDDNLYLISDAGIASCLDAKTGHPKWTHRVGGKYSASPLYGDGMIYLQSEAGETILFRPHPDRYEEVARNTVGERSLATPAVIESALLIRTDSALYRIENR